MRRRLLLLAAGVALAAVLLIAMIGRNGRDPLERAADRVRDDGNFATAQDSGETLALVGEDLLAAARTCSGEKACAALLSASGWAQTAAVRVLRCTRPGIAQTRTDAANLLATLQTRPQASPLTLPPVPAC